MSNLIIEQPHFVHPDDVALSGQMRNGPLADPEDAVHSDYVATARAWLEQYLLGEFNRLALKEPSRWAGHDAPQVRELTEPYTDADGRVWQLPYQVGGVTYTVGWIGTLTVHENPDWKKPSDVRGGE